MSNEMVVKSANNPLGIQGYQSFDSTIEELPMILPYLRIGQKDELSGQIVDNSGTGMDLSSVCIVKVTTSRVMWQKPYNPAIKNPLCKSFDGQKPDINLFLSGKADGRPPAETCASCPYSKNTDASGEWKRSECDLQIVLWGINVAEEMPFVLTLTGMSLSSKTQNKGFLTVKQMLSDIKMRRQPVYLFDVEISVGKAKGAQGSAYVALFKKSGQFNQDQLESLSYIIRDMAGRTSSDLEQSEEYNPVVSEQESDIPY